MAVRKFWLGAFALLFLVSSAAVPGQEAKKPLTLEGMLAIPKVATVALAPSGAMVAFDVMSVDWEHNGYTSEVWLADVAAGRTFAVTKGQGMNMSPAWSPDGRTLTFLSTRLGPPQVFAFKPGFGEAEALFKAPAGVIKYAWAPDGKSITFLTSEPPDPEKQKAVAAGFDAYDIDAGAARSQLHVYDLEKGAVKPLVAGDFHIIGFSWSPDGSKLAIVSSPRNCEQVTWQTQTLSVVNRDGGGLKALDFKYYAAYTRAGEAVWSPDGRFVGLEVGDLAKPELYGHIIQVCDLATGKTFNASGAADHFLYNCRWSTDGGIYYIAYHDMNSQIFRLDVQKREVRQVSHFPKIEINQMSMSADGRTVAFSATTPTRPHDIYVAGVGAVDKARRITNIYPDLDKTWITEPETISWKGEGGLDIKGNVYYPIGYEKGKAYPTVTLIHGGPAGNFGNGFCAIYYCPAQYYAGQGYLVYAPEIRGSIGWGSEFMRKNVRDWGGADYRDLMAGLDLLVKRGLADKDRLVVWGGSYGGFMTNWIVTQTRRFKAAVSEVSIANLVSLWSVSPIGRIMFRHYFGKTPLEDPEIYRRLSPLTHAMNVRTPLLLTQNEKDERVTLEQAIEFYRAVALTGTPAELHIYPGEGHGTRKPNHQLDKIRKTEQWFKKYLPH
ncbi:MAG: S9 family peptidase [Acidobacteriota bacterium]